MRATCLWVIFTCTVACAGRQPAALLNTCSEYAPQSTDPNAARPSVERIRAQAHALFGALDRADEAAFGAELGETFAQIDTGVVRGRAYLVDELRARVARAAPERTRAWQNERIWVSDAAAVFVGEAIVHAPRNPADLEHPGEDFAGWNTLVFARERGTFRAVSWQWVGSGSAR